MPIIYINYNRVYSLSLRVLNLGVYLYIFFFLSIFSLFDRAYACKNQGALRESLLKCSFYLRKKIASKLLLKKKTESDYVSE